MFSLSIYVFIALVSTLSMILYTGLNPLFDRYVMFFLKHSTIVSAFASFIGVDKMALDVQSDTMNIAAIPCIDFVGKFPVKSAYIVPNFLSTYHNVMNILFILSFFQVGSCIVLFQSVLMHIFILSVIDIKPFLCLFMCPLSVSGHDSGGYFWTSSVVRPGHVVNLLFIIALRSVDLEGQKSRWCRYLMSSSFDVIW